VGLDVAVATGCDLRVDDAPEFPRTMVTSVQQRIALGEQAGQKVRRIGAGFSYTGDIQHSQAPVVPASTGFPCTPAPRSLRNGEISWSA
jgi:hypothetical protein